MLENHEDHVQGSVAAGLEPVRDELAQIATEDPGYAAQFCAYRNGVPIVDLCVGPDVELDGLQVAFSVTKGIAAICIGILLDRGQLELDAPMVRYWPDFAQGGKSGVTVRLALSHQAGVVGVEPQVTYDQMLDHTYMAERVAGQTPHWRPGAACGYHALTIGTMMDELVRRIDGRTLAAFLDDEVAGPREIDAHIATPNHLQSRVKSVLPMREPTADEIAQLGAVAPMTPDSLAGMAMNAAMITDPAWLLGLANDPGSRAIGHAAATGVVSARSLALLYSSCISEVNDAPRLLTETTTTAMSQVQADGVDIVLRVPTTYGIVFQRPTDRLRLGSHRAFGHDGAGGAFGAADPWHALAYGYIPRRMTFPGGADERGMRVLDTLRNCLFQK